MKQFGDIYRGRRVLITGHTGFKGSWLAAWLTQMGAEVTGLALSPSNNELSHWGLLQIPARDIRGDIRDLAVVQDAFKQVDPEIVFHLAAQALVRRSYRNPLESWSTNVMGTANVLESCRLASSVRAVLVVTTDKVYANNEWHWGYRENDRIGGHDPYSASKAACELTAESYRKSFWNTDDAPLMATARAGNVIGGGDWSEDRLIPDLVRAVHTGIPLEIRSPLATRPWQHVLECLSGYLLIGQRLLERRKEFSEAWNFGPAPDDNRKVIEVLKTLKKFWPELIWAASTSPQMHEASLLYLDSSKSRSLLNWAPIWSLETGISRTADWYRNFYATGKAMTLEQLDQYIHAAYAAGSEWVA